MLEDVIKAFVKAATEIAVKDGVLIREDGILLNPSTVELVNEIEQSNRQHLIDNALATGNRELFMQLTTQKEEIQ